MDEKPKVEGPAPPVIDAREGESGESTALAGRPVGEAADVRGGVAVAGSGASIEDVPETVITIEVDDDDDYDLPRPVVTATTSLGARAREAEAGAGDARMRPLRRPGVEEALAALSRVGQRPDPDPAALEALDALIAERGVTDERLEREAARARERVGQLVEKLAGDEGELDWLLEPPRPEPLPSPAQALALLERRPPRDA